MAWRIQRGRGQLPMPITASARTDGAGAGCGSARGVVTSTGRCEGGASLDVGGRRVGCGRSASAELQELAPPADRCAAG
jgi:hypothetical protein